MQLGGSWRAGGNTEERVRSSQMQALCVCACLEVFLPEANAKQRSRGSATGTQWVRGEQRMAAVS